MWILPALTCYTPKATWSRTTPCNGSSLYLTTVVSWSFMTARAKPIDCKPTGVGPAPLFTVFSLSWAHLTLASFSPFIFLHQTLHLQKNNHNRNSAGNGKILWCYPPHFNTCFFFTIWRFNYFNISLKEVFSDTHFPQKSYVSSFGNC